MTKYSSCLFVVLLSVSCSRYPADVEQTLKFAGDNRVELEKVLTHYLQNEADSLKYKAACFLIGNMRYHHGKNNKILDTFRQYTLSIEPTQQKQGTLVGMGVCKRLEYPQSGRIDPARFTLRNMPGANGYARLCDAFTGYPLRHRYDGAAS